MESVLNYSLVIATYPITANGDMVTDVQLVRDTYETSSFYWKNLFCQQNNDFSQKEKNKVKLVY